VVNQDYIKTLMMDITGLNFRRGRVYRRVLSAGRSGLLIFLLFFPTALVCAQELSTGSRRAERFYLEGRYKWQLRDYREALDLLKRATDIDPGFYEAYLVTGQVHFDLGEFRNAASAFSEALELNPGFFPVAYYNLGVSYLRIGEYAPARDAFADFLARDDISEEMRKLAEKNLLNCNFAIEAIKNPVPFDPVSLDETVNTDADEYWPTLTADEETLIFTRQTLSDPDAGEVPGNYREDFYVSRMENGNWSIASFMGEPLASEQNEGAPSITPDGRKIYFTACNREDGFGSCDIYAAKRTGDSWSEPQNLGTPVNTHSWEAQPSVSADGRTLYFASNRSGGKGNMDIWKSTKEDDGSWSDPVNLGDVINTPGNEMSPFIHLDGRTLYFASDGHPGMGGMDLFVSFRAEDGQWSEPENLGYPINTYHDEIGLIINASGDMAYFASDRMEGRGKDIYVFELHPEARPREVSYMKGTVYDSETRRRLHARFEIIDIETAEIEMEAWSDENNGEFLIPIVTGLDYALNVSREGYLFYSEHFSLSGYAGQTDPFLMDIPLQPIKQGEKVVLRNIFFEFDSYNLMEESVAELTRLYDFLENNPSLRIRINGHTDSTGDPEYNFRLSERRAEEVVRFLEEKGIDPERMEHKGFGETEPVAGNETEKGRALNRRTEFEIIE